MSSTFEIELNWKNQSETFKFDEFSRDHEITYSGAQKLKNSSAPDFMGSLDASNPEELLLSALASCHMLTFFAVASKSGFIISSYHDKPQALLGKNDSGKFCVTEITLSPKIEFIGEKIPSAEQLKSLHDRAHRNCFIAQSINSKVTIN